METNLQVIHMLRIILIPTFQSLSFKKICVIFVMAMESFILENMHFLTILAVSNMFWGNAKNSMIESC